MKVVYVFLFTCVVAQLVFPWLLSLYVWIVEKRFWVWSKKESTTPLTKKLFVINEKFKKINFYINIFVAIAIVLAGFGVK